MSAALGKPPRAATLGRPPAPEESKSNLKSLSQFNVRLEPEKHAEIKIAAIREGMSLGEYLLMLHDQHQARKGA